MDDREMRRRIEAAFDFVDRVRKHPERYSDEAVLFLLEPAEVASALTKERLQILRQLRRTDCPSLVALARALGRDVRQVRKDLVASNAWTSWDYPKRGTGFARSPRPRGFTSPCGRADEGGGPLLATCPPLEARGCRRPFQQIGR